MNMMDAGAEARRSAGYGEVTPDRVNSRNGYRARMGHPGREDRAGEPEAAARPALPVVPGAPAPRRARPGLVVTTSCLLGVSTRRVKKLAASLGVTGPPKSQVRSMPAEPDEPTDGLRNRRLDVGPYMFAWPDALTQNRAATWEPEYSPPCRKAAQSKMGQEETTDAGLIIEEIPA
jgi:putative transposase